MLRERQRDKKRKTIHHFFERKVNCKPGVCKNSTIKRYCCCHISLSNNWNSPAESWNVALQARFTSASMFRLLLAAVGKRTLGIIWTAVFACNVRTKFNRKSEFSNAICIFSPSILIRFGCNMFVLLCGCKVHHFSRFPAPKISAVVEVAHAHCLIAIAALTKRSASHTEQAEQANTKNPFNWKLGASGRAQRERERLKAKNYSAYSWSNNLITPRTIEIDLNMLIASFIIAISIRFRCIHAGYGLCRGMRPNF